MSRTATTGRISLEHPWSCEIEGVLKELSVDQEEGLTSKQVQQRLQEYGPNQLKRHKKRTTLSILIDQFKSLIIALLLAAAVVAFWLGEVIDGAAILIVILLNTLIGFFTELRAVRSMEALFKMGIVKTRVRRDGNVREVDATELVPGDIVIVEGGDIITADLRIIGSSKLQADESALTGESMPVEKKPEAVADEEVLAERSSMLYKGTAVTRGAGEGIVVGTGLQTELGHISALVAEAEEEQTPLQERLDKLGYRLIWVTLLIAVFVIGSGILAGKDLYLMVETGIALAVAAIPEGLPIVATIALAKGVRIMAEKNALINRLSSVETLGATGVICTDKTGTLTENKMTVTEIYLSDGDSPSSENGYRAFSMTEKAEQPAVDSDLQRALETGALCNNASIGDTNGVGTGDPLEIALLNAAKSNGISREALIRRYPESREEAFDPAVKMMATWNRLEDANYRVHVKGAPESVLKASTKVLIDEHAHPMDQMVRDTWLDVNRKLAEEGFRVIALAVKNVPDSDGDPYEELAFVGLAALSDPPRLDVKPAIERCYQAGVRVVMVTGDQVATARYIAESVGLKNDGKEVVHGNAIGPVSELDPDLLASSVFARVSPKQKLDLIDAYQRQGHIVAMTGDGVNDAPALKKADIGIAMGQRGTQVAREAADMVLTDDAFSTIVAAVEQGRVIFGNIRRFIYYLMSCNVSEVMVVALASILGTPLPILPLQILFLNLVTDVFPALALGVGEGQEGVMRKKPRNPESPILGKSQWIGITSYGLVITVSVLSSLYIALYHLQLSPEKAVTISFLTLAMAQLWHVFNMGSAQESWWDNSVTRNPFIWGALLLCIGLLIGAVYIPVVSDVLKLHPPTMWGWGTVIILSLVPLLFGQFRYLHKLMDE